MTCSLNSLTGCQCHVHRGAVRIRVHAAAQRLARELRAADALDRAEERKIPAHGAHYPSRDNCFPLLVPSLL